MAAPSPECKKALACLKDFQRRTVDHVFERMYGKTSSAHRFLIADEVGLGKTMVARGLIARTVDHLREAGVDRIDVVYVCSNAAIAQQNLDRLNPSGKKHVQFARRLTLLPAYLDSLRENSVNFISFTPGTTFDLKSRGGIAEERALIYRMLSRNPDLDPNGLLQALQGTCSPAGWKWWAEEWNTEIDDGLAQSFLKRVSNDDALRSDLTDICKKLAGGPAEEARELTWDVIGRLRQTLASVCIDKLEPDLVILDEFQRFRHLLEGESEAAELARTLMTYKSSEGPDTQVRVLLMSATPYRMFTLAADPQDDHYHDLLRTFRFLCSDDGRTEKLEKELSRFREDLCTLGACSTAEIERTRKSVRKMLSAVMVRTERGPNSDSRNAMLEDVVMLGAVETEDLRDARELQRIAAAVGAGDITEYWKSAPYLLNFMRDYELPVKLRRTGGATSEVPLQKLAERALTAGFLEDYRPIEARNARLRQLMADTLDAGQWRALWIPPSLPYTEPQGPYADGAPASKVLLFSSWNVVPDAIAMICSYEAERRMLEGSADSIAYSELTKKKKALLRFSPESDGGTTGMNALALEYPSPTLSRIVDPLKVALASGQGKPVSCEMLLDIAGAAVRQEFERAGIGRRAAEGRVDQRWYLAAPVLLDCRRIPGYREWLLREGPWAVRPSGELSEDESESCPSQLVSSLHDIVRKPRQLGRMPDDLVETLALLSVAGPGCCALRSLVRVTGVGYRGFLSNEPGAELMASAALVARGFRTLFNLPETIMLLRGGETGVPYWRIVLAHNLKGNLQALLDEYFHLLRELLGLMDHPAADVAEGISGAASSALSLRPSNLRFSLIPPSPSEDWASFSVRCRYAMRFADIRDEGSAIVRAGTVRDAFNSPFRPFILASTSIGQEGLDFHPYCHKVYHWNLPSNPVDMEQREGRVSRYKGHAVRKNLAAHLGLRELVAADNGSHDPWDTLFRLAAKRRPAGANDLIPYWIYEIDGGARIERRVPVLQYSREVARYKRLKQALAIYRLVFGQPRQQDLLEFLEDQEPSKELVDSLCISLAP